MTLKEARNKVGLTQKELSKWLGIPRRTIEDWDSGKKSPNSWTKALLIEKILNYKGDNKMNVRYEIVKSTSEHADKYYEGITRGDFDLDDEILKSFGALGEAKEALKDYECSCVKCEGIAGNFYKSEEYVLQENIYNESGEYIDGGDILEYAQLGIDESHYQPEQSEIDFVAAYENTHHIAESDRVTFKNSKGNFETISFLYNFNKTPSDRAEREFLNRLNEGAYELDIDMSDVRNSEYFNNYSEMEKAFFENE